jgi:hypothetical protein
MRAYVEIKLADLKTAKCTHNHNKIVSITWNTFESGMFIRFVSARNPGNIGRGSEAAAFGLHVTIGSGGSVSARASRYSWLDEGRDFFRRLPTLSKPLRRGEGSGTCGSRRKLADWFGSGNVGSCATRRRPGRIQRPTVGS